MSGVARAVAGTALLTVWSVACGSEPPKSELPGHGTPAVVFTAAGDYGDSANARATFQRIGQAGARFHLALGDFSYRRDLPESSWCDLVMGYVGASFPFLLVAGNHEDDSGGDGHISAFAACLPDRIGVTGVYGAEYYFDYAGLVRVILIAPGLTIRGEHYYYGDETRHSRWLRGAIDGARQAGLPWVIVGMHKSCLSLGPYYCEIHSGLVDLLLESRVDLTLHAHDHSYQRTKQLALGAGCPSLTLDEFDPDCVADAGAGGVYRKGVGTISAVIGTGGADLYALNEGDPEGGYLARWMGHNVSPRHGILQVRVSPRELVGQFIGSTATSDFTDRFVIRNGP
jgi:hypothetical protein